MKAKLEAPSPRFTPATLIGFGLALLTSGVHARALNYGFVNYDDEVYVTQNSHVMQGLSLEGLSWALTTTEASNWHPLTWISLQLDSQLFDGATWGYHLTNVLLHTATVLLVFGVFRVMTGDLWPSAFLAALFAVHPLRVESVAWVAERKDTLSALLWMLSLAAWVRYVKLPSWARYSTAVVLFALGLAAKPMVVTLPFVLVLLDYWPLRRRPLQAFSEPDDGPGRFPRLSWLAKSAAEKLPFFVLAGLSCWLTARAQNRGDAIRSLKEWPLAVRVDNALVAYAAYLLRTFWPVNLAVFYPHLGKEIPVWQTATAAVVLLGVTVGVMARARRAPYAVVGWFWFLGTLVPVIGIIQMGLQASADRYTYIPHIGLLLVIVWAFANLGGRFPGYRTSLAYLGGATLVMWSILTWRQTGVWSDSENLWRHALEVTNQNYVAHNNLGEVLQRRGASKEAAAEYTQAIEIKPDFVMAYFNQGRLNADLKNLDEAERAYRKTLSISPEFANAHNNLGQLLMLRGRTDEAIEEFQRAIEISPKLGLAHFNLGVALANLGRMEEAAVHFEVAVQRKPKMAAAHNNLALALAMIGKHDEALQAFQEAARLEPGNAKYSFDLAHAFQEVGQTASARQWYQHAIQLEPQLLRAVNQAAWGLATSPEARRRNGVLAVQLAKQLCEATEYRNPMFIDTLAAALAESGQFQEAAETARRALALMKASGSNPERPIQERLQLYESRRPYRADATSLGP